ncbi:unnamed protein product [Aureobasidium uvarum]|uniref:Uncharacterized protein n=1 Tax=Aureobasidium uvarum TaxID=2773716 RepID=A0A9N8K6E2_9PEZI|nr:unnamed protein product [Aureobasidium uvarum]
MDSSIINTVLKHGQEERKVDKDFINRWVLVQRPHQVTFHKPTEPPVHAFESGFLGASVKALQEFVSSNFGQSGLGSSSSDDWIAHDAFAVIDARTGEGEDLTEEDAHHLFQNLRDQAGNMVVNPLYTTLESGMEQMNKWLGEQGSSGHLVWIEARMASAGAITKTYGIWNIGVVAALTQAKDTFLDT